MGMDYIGRKPIKPVGEHLHLNWLGHGQLHILLTQLRCDIKGWSGLNNGEILKKKVCQGFSHAIRQALAEDGLVDVASDRCEDGLTVTKEWAESENQENRPVSDENRTWLVEVADFFANCGGCEQW
jgi:hypothetical protein